MSGDIKTTADQRKAALMEYRGALDAALSAASSADAILHGSLLPESFKRAFFDSYRMSDQIGHRIREVDAALDFLEGTDRLKRAP